MRRAAVLGLLAGWTVGLGVSLYACDPGCRSATPEPEEGRYVVVDAVPPELDGVTVEIRSLTLTLPLLVDGEWVDVSYYTSYHNE